MFLNNMNIEYKGEVPMKKLVIGLFTMLFLICCIFPKEVPSEKDGVLYFLKSDISIPVRDHVKINGLNNREVIVTDTVKLFHESRRVFFITEERYPNYSEYKVLIYDFHGKEVNRIERIQGEIVFFFLEKKARVIIGQKATLVHASESYLYDCNGKLIETLTHDEQTKEIGISNDESIVWFISNRMRKLEKGEKPLYPSMDYTAYNHVIVYDTSTGKIRKEISGEGKNQVIIKINNTEYEIKLPKADIPG